MPTKRTHARTVSRSSKRAGTARADRKAALKQHRAGYPLHKRAMLHPLGIFVMLCAGVFMTGWTYQAVASTTISSKIQAPSLQAAATIQSPSSSKSFSSPTVTVDGTCPNNSYVTLGINAAFHGAALCTNNSYSLQASLYSGTNTLEVQAYNLTDMAGPATPTIEVVYTPPPAPAVTQNKPVAAVPSSQPSASSQPVATPTPLILSSDFNFHTFSTQNQFTWTVDLEGGTPPYLVNVNWGDGNSSQYKFPGDPVFSIGHTFKDSGYYPIIINSTDSQNQVHVMQLAALITDKHGKAAFLSSGTAGPLGPPANGPGGPGGLHGLPPNPFGPMSPVGYKWLLVAWPFYLIVILMAVSFWLGEKREFALVGAWSNRKAAPRRRR